MFKWMAVAVLVLAVPVYAQGMIQQCYPNKEFGKSLKEGSYHELLMISGQYIPGIHMELYANIATGTFTIGLKGANRTCMILAGRQLKIHKIKGTAL